MPCCGDREKGQVSLEEQWDYINLDDFKSESCITPFSYFFLFVLLLISLAVYAVDTFTAVNLLIFSKWAGQIKPAIPFNVSRWIFAVCILVSFGLLAFRWLRAIRAIRSGSIAQSYLDSLAVRIQSIRPGKSGRGWRRFLVFAELTKSKKGAEYVALFSYFSFETWMNIVFADGPRQVVNAFTLYEVMQMNLIGDHISKDNDAPAVVQFFQNVKILADENNLRALVLFGMLFTLVIWVLSVLRLLLAIILYLLFLFHHIPSQDGTLSTYCRRKINTRLMRIVHRKVDKALAKGVALQNRAPTNPNMGIDRKPTLPILGDDDKTPAIATISRSTTQTTLPPYSSRPGTAGPERNPTLPDVGMFEKPPLSRTVTQSSAYSESASLSGATMVSGYSPLERQGSPAPPVPTLPSVLPMQRTQTPMSRPTYSPAPSSSVRGPSRMPSANGFREPGDVYTSRDPYRPNNTSVDPYRTYTPMTDPNGRSRTPGTSGISNDTGPARNFSPSSYAPTPGPGSQSGYPLRTFTPASQGATRPQPSSTPIDSAMNRTFSPVDRNGTPQSSQPAGYVAFNPSARGSPAPTMQAMRSDSPSDYSSHAPPARTYTPSDYSQPPQRYQGDYF
ncbi:hypothetical protein FE257_008422 [Aspergillus nanangensis]|uniref:Pheromone-regulated membrane protein n=1 Tax=Aspergillus nanangensis TaxID=2582783 RepID=A0AAD4CLD6_ASPNN|nr:hypothetical protein FE257_008422 [Aspergillus nanangensis]